MNLRIAFIVNCVGIAGGAFASSQLVQANEYYTVRSSRAAEPCTALGNNGSGAGASERCMRYGGRVRVEFNGRQPAALDGAWGAAPAAMRMNGAVPGNFYQDMPVRAPAGMSRSRLRLPEDVAGSIVR
jgi:hypothetical protein